MDIDEIRVVNLSTHWRGRSGILPWEIRSDEFTFPTPPAQPSEVRLERELSPEELARRRYYVDVRAIPLQPEDVPDPGRLFLPAIGVIFEIVGGILTTPRLKNWREHMVKRFVTDLAHFRHYRPATRHEIELFERTIEEVYPKGIPV